MSPARKRTRTLPISEWPQADQERHVRAFQEGDLFEEGPGARLRDASRKDFEFAWGRWLKFLEDNDPEALELAGPERMTFARLRAFVEHLSVTCSNSSILTVLSALSQAALLLYPKETIRPSRTSGPVSSFPEARASHRADRGSSNLATS